MIFSFSFCVLQPPIYSTSSRTLHMLGTQIGVRETPIKNVPDVWEDRCTNWQILRSNGCARIEWILFIWTHYLLRWILGRHQGRSDIYMLGRNVSFFCTCMCASMWVLTCMDAFGGQRLKLECLPHLLCHLIFKTYLLFFDNFIGAQVVTDNSHPPPHLASHSLTC